MKYFSLLAFFFFLNSVSAQEYSFQLYSKNPCNDKEVIDTSSYSISKVIKHWKSPTEFFYGYLESGKDTIGLPGPGTYVVKYNHQFDPLIDTIQISQPGLYKHKHHETKITRKVYGPFFDYTYEVCGELAQGYVENHYKNGNISVKGNFINGEADEITYYYPDAKIKEELRRHGKTYYGKAYDSLGRQSSKFRSNYTKVAKWHDYDLKVTYYYPNGKKACERILKKGIHLTRLYYTNGNNALKISRNKRIDYFENGAKKKVYTWEIKKTSWEFVDAGYGSPFIVEKAYGDAYVITCKEYDIKGKLLSTTTQVDPYIKSKQAIIATVGIPQWFNIPLIYDYLL